MSKEVYHDAHFEDINQGVLRGEGTFKYYLRGFWRIPLFLLTLAAAMKIRDITRMNTDDYEDHLDWVLFELQKNGKSYDWFYIRNLYNDIYNIK